MARAIGIAVNDCQSVLRVLDEAPLDAVMLAARLTPLDASGLQAVAPRCLRDGVGLLAAAPFNTGILATGSAVAPRFAYQPAPPEVLARTRQIERICAEHHVPLSAAALQFPLRHPAVVCVVQGACTAEQLRANARAVCMDLPEAFWAALSICLDIA